MFIYKDAELKSICEIFRTMISITDKYKSSFVQKNNCHNLKK